MTYWTEEQQLLNDVISLADSYGILWFHDYDSRKNPSGFPDLVLIGHKDMMFVELKSQSGSLGKYQAQWKYTLLAIGANYSVWKPSDLACGHVESVLENL